MSNANDFEQKVKGTSEPESNNGKGGFILFGLIALAGIAGLIYLMVISSPETSVLVKDTAIILFIFGSLLFTASLIVLILQISKLINLLKNEIKPILETTKETAHNVKGTVSFLSDNAVTPVIQTNSKIAGVRSVTKILFPGIKNKRRS